MLHRSLDIRQRIKRQELRSFRQFSTPAIQVSFEVHLLAFLLLLSALTEVLIVVRVVNVDDKIDMQIKL